MTSFIQSVDARTRLAGANQLEALLFSLGRDTSTDRDEPFGINVFKVREVMHAPEITRSPEMSPVMEGMVSLRGTVVPVINLQKFCGVNAAEPPKILIVTEYNKHVQGFLVDSVDCIVRLAWDDVKEPPPMMATERGGLVTAVTELEDGRLVQIMDVEKVLAESAGFYQDDTLFQGIERIDVGASDATVLFADDSRVARDQISTTLQRMGLQSISTRNGVLAWEQLIQMADQAEQEGRPITDFVRLIVTDVEMPEMDGYVLTQSIKDDTRFQQLPVIMHSSLSANQELGAALGADAYVSKFDPKDLASTIERLLAE